MDASRKSPEAVCCRALRNSLAPAELLLEMADWKEEVRSRADLTPSFTPELALSKPDELFLISPDDPAERSPLSVCKTTGLGRSVIQHYMRMQSSKLGFGQI